MTNLNMIFHVVVSVYRSRIYLNLKLAPIAERLIVAKVFERIVYEQLYAYLEEHDILCRNQSGFSAYHSTVAALLEATDSLGIWYW